MVTGAGAALAGTEIKNDTYYAVMTPDCAVTNTAECKIESTGTGLTPTAVDSLGSTITTTYY